MDRVPYNTISDGLNTQVIYRILYKRSTWYNTVLYKEDGTWYYHVLIVFLPRYLLPGTAVWYWYMVHPSWPQPWRKKKKIGSKIASESICSELVGCQRKVARLFFWQPSSKCILWWICFYFVRGPPAFWIISDAGMVPHTGRSKDVLFFSNTDKMSGLPRGVKSWEKSCPRKLCALGVSCLFLGNPKDTVGEYGLLAKTNACREKMGEKQRTPKTKI